MRITGYTALALAIGIGTAAPASGQTPARTFDELEPHVSAEQTLLVTDHQGHTLKGKLISVAGTTLTLRSAPTKANPSGQLTFDQKDVVKIRRADSVLNGLLIGLAAGVGTMVVFTRANCGGPGYDPECSAIVNLVGLVSFVPGGLITGALVDRAIKKTVFQSSTTGPAVSVAPMIGRDAGGVRVTLRF